RVTPTTVRGRRTSGGGTISNRQLPASPTNRKTPKASVDVVLAARVGIRPSAIRVATIWKFWPTALPFGPRIWPRRRSFAGQLSSKAVANGKVTGFEAETPGEVASVGGAAWTK